MANLFALKQDNSKANDGIWRKYEMGIQFKLAKMGNERYAKEIREYMDRDELEDLSAQAERDIINRLAPSLAMHVVKDWKNVEIPDKESGELTKPSYDPKLMEEFLKDPAFIDLARWVLSECSANKNYRVDLEKEDEKAKN